MREIKELLVSKINELIDNGTVDRVIGWKAGEFCYDVSPAIFTKENLDELVYNSFCGANQSKFLVGAATMDVHSVHRMHRNRRSQRRSLHCLSRVTATATISCRQSTDWTQRRFMHWESHVPE